MRRMIETSAVTIKILDVRLALVSKRGILTVSAFVLMIAAWYTLNWEWVRAPLLGVLKGIFRTIGFNVASSGYMLCIETKCFEVTPDCSYIDLFLCMTPFIWRKGSLLENLTRLMMMGVIIAAIDLARLTFAIAMNVLGADWFMVHDLVDYALWYPSLTVAIVLWLKWTRTPLPASELTYGSSAY